MILIRDKAEFRKRLEWQAGRLAAQRGAAKSGTAEDKHVRAVQHGLRLALEALDAWDAHDRTAKEEET